MKKYFAYIRVSTVKQGERGSSLQEQRAAIDAFAKRGGLNITAWYEETETAAKQGRREFTRMLAALDRGDADGIIIHKIDRGARNLRDWANLGDLIDRGLDVRFVHDNLDLHSRGGRLSADIQAVVAADYIRNLRDEVRKGFYGRLKQGYYPLPAPVGYLDRGKAQAKVLDPVKAPLVRYAFERYGSNSLSLVNLKSELTERGLTSRTGRALTVGGLSKILHNPFYMGLMHIDRTNETFQGNHEPLVSQVAFNRVQNILRGKSAAKVQKHDFLMRRLVRCEQCGRLLTGERQKEQYVYYRCHTDTCRVVARETDLRKKVGPLLRSVVCTEEELGDLRDMVRAHIAGASGKQDAQKAAIQLQLSRCEARLSALTDALLDGIIGKEDFDARKRALLDERLSLNERLAELGKRTSLEVLFEKFELQNPLILGFDSVFLGDQREALDIAVSNWTVGPEKQVITLHSPYQQLATAGIEALGGPFRDDVRTRAGRILQILEQHAGDPYVGHEVPKAPTSLEN